MRPPLGFALEGSQDPPGLSCLQDTLHANRIALSQQTCLSSEDWQTWVSTSQAVKPCPHTVPKVHAVANCTEWADSSEA